MHHFVAARATGFESDIYLDNRRRTIRVLRGQAVDFGGVRDGDQVHRRRRNRHPFGYGAALRPVLFADVYRDDAAVVVAFAEVESVERAGVADVGEAAERLRFVNVPECDVRPVARDEIGPEQHVVGLADFVKRVRLRAAHVQVCHQHARQRFVEAGLIDRLLDPRTDAVGRRAIALFGAFESIVGLGVTVRIRVWHQYELHLLATAFQHRDSRPVLQVHSPR